MKVGKKGGGVLRAVLVVILVGLMVACGGIWWYANREVEIVSEQVEVFEPVYSVLTGEEVADAAVNTAPTFCVQIPNGSLDGARPQAGLTKAGVVFEAIAERGITRFAAVFQNPQTGVIGPIRSLRPYYLEWDTPFDCAVVHVGGSDEALAAIAWGGQKNLDYDESYMWRETGTGRYWNDVFTSPALLGEFAKNRGYNESAPKAFLRAEPEEREGECGVECEGDGCGEKECEAEVTRVEVKFNYASWAYNVVYEYDGVKKKYLRYYADGEAHRVYDCPEGAMTTAGCPLVQAAPSVLAVMKVEEGTMADGYHENIRTVGTGEAVVFQNGQAVKGSWTKKAEDEQVVFRDEAGEVLALTPGQLWVMAISRTTGSVSYR